MTQEKIVANFDACDERPSGARTAFVASGKVVNVNVDQPVRLALLDHGDQFGMFAVVNVIPNLMQFTRVGPALGWALMRQQAEVHADSMSITCDDHIDGQATLYLAREGKVDLPVVRLVGFDAESGLHVIELSTCVAQVELDQPDALRQTAA
jgi:hypothetical protein